MLNRRQWLLSLTALGNKPNVLLINTDDQRWDTIRALGNAEIITPNLDALVRRGFVFRNYYCQGSLIPAVCLPSRTMLMTGRSLSRIPGRQDPPVGFPLLPKGLAVGGRHGLMCKQNLYEHFKAPLIFAGPGLKPGATNALAYVHDMFPTLAGLAQLPVPAGVEGTSLAPVIAGKKKAVRTHLFGAYRDVQRMVRDGRWKLIWYPKINRFQLFDLANDPDELKDLTAERTEKSRITAMKKKMAAMQHDLGDNAAPRPLQLLRFARRRHQAVRAHVGHNVPVVLIGVHVIEEQHAGSRPVLAKEFDCLQSGSPGHAGVNFVAVSN